MAKPNYVCVLLLLLPRKIKKKVSGSDLGAHIYDEQINKSTHVQMFFLPDDFLEYRYRDVANEVPFRSWGYVPTVAKNKQTNLSPTKMLCGVAYISS